MQKYLTKTKSTILGNLQQPRKGLQSTQGNNSSQHQSDILNQDNTNFPHSCSQKTPILSSLRQWILQGNVYTHQTGRLPIKSSKRIKYILAAYHYESNTVHAERLTTQTWIDLKTTYHKLHRLLTNRSLKPSQQILENECINVLKTFMTEVNENFQLVPPHVHHMNSAERVIRNFREHFIAGLASTHKDFPLHLWVQLLPHVSLTLNLLQKSRMNPKTIWECPTPWRI